MGTFNVIAHITVTQKVPDSDLHPDDLKSNPVGTYRYRASSEDEVMVLFHREIPIKNLEHFDIVLTRRPS